MSAEPVWPSEALSLRWSTQLRLSRMKLSLLITHEAANEGKKPQRDSGAKTYEPS